VSELEDRIAVHDLLARYTVAIDTHAWDDLDDVFTPDATIDYTSSGGIKGMYPEIKAWLAEVLPGFAMTQHLLGLPLVTFDRDTATSRTEFYNPMGTRNADGSLSLFYVGGSYQDRLVRTPTGWRIVERTEVQSWSTLGT
jgi:3-phenylpropionate/cinnamic acid dioxygenase small subunit